MCESRYAYKTKSFKKIKVNLDLHFLKNHSDPHTHTTHPQNWSYLGNPPVLSCRATPLSVINRVPSIFVTTSKQTTPTKNQASPPPEVKEEEPKVIGPLDVSYVGLSLKNIVTTASNPDSNIYYEQYCIDEDFFRLGMDG